MKRWPKIASIVVAGAMVVGSSGITWYALSAPPVQHLELAQDLIAATTAEGTRIILRTSAKIDYQQLVPELVPQSRRAFCGVASSVAVINAALQPLPRLTQETLFTSAAAAVRSELAVSFRGLTLEQLARIIRAHGLEVRMTHAAQSNLDSFRALARDALAEPQVFLIVNYDRATLGQKGPGHISPVGAYDVETDRLLVLDVAGYKYPYTWVPAPKLWSAMNTTDSDSGKTRGYLLVSAGTARR